MTEKRQPSAAAAARETKIRQLEKRVAQLEASLKAALAERIRSRGQARVRVKKVEEAVAGQITRAQAALRDSADRLRRALRQARRRPEVRRQIARAQATVQDSLDRVGRSLAHSRRTLRREVGLLGRGLRAGLKAGTEAYRRKPR
ncbi:MAG TPA: hypothetical protein VFN71_04780 [Methylomirabilota bacterium]|nr:hypothetical protein [Methylomirabilota bacterium]